MIESLSLGVCHVSRFAVVIVALPLGDLWTGIHDVNRHARLDGPREVQAKILVSFLAVPRTKQFLSLVIRIPKRQFFAEIVLLFIRRVRKQRVVAREVVLINSLSFGSTRTIGVKGAREPVQYVEQCANAICELLAKGTPARSGAKQSSAKVRLLNLLVEVSLKSSQDRIGGASIAQHFFQFGNVSPVV